MKKIVLKNKRFMALALSVFLLLGTLIPVLSYGVTTAHAHRAVDSSIKTFYEIEFADNTTDKKFTDGAIEFLFKLEKKFIDEENNEIDGYSLSFTKEDMDKSDMNLPEDMKFITKENYPYYDTPNTQTLQAISLTADNLIQDYYIGDLSERKEVKVRNEEEVGVIVLSAPILKLNRNVEKTVVGYEGNLSEETKNELIAKVKEANPNMANMKEIYIKENKLIIETWNRFYTGTPYLEFDVENLITRVAHTETQTESKIEVKVIYQFKDGTAYKEFIVESDKGAILDASDLEMLPDDMAFDDEFMFYEVKGDGIDIITRIVKKTKEDASTQTEDKTSQTDTNENKQSVEVIQKVEINLGEIDKLISELDKRIASSEKNTLTSEQEARIRDLEKQKEELAKLLEETKKDSKTEKSNTELNAKVDELVKKNNELSDKLNKLIDELNKQAENLNKTGNTSNADNTNKNNSSVTDGSKEVVANKDAKDNGYYSEKSEKEIEIRYPNKLTAKTVTNADGGSTGGSTQTANSYYGTSKTSETDNTHNVVVAAPSDPSKARGTVTENVDNGNGEYPIHHSGSMECACGGMYSADARQFITFQTKSGKTFHLIINHDEDSENVMLLTEVSEADLLNMVETKTEEKQSVTKEEPVKEDKEKEDTEKSEEPVKEEKKQSGFGSYLLMILVGVGALGGGYYLKVFKAKEKKELEALEEPEDFISESSEELTGDVESDYDDYDETGEDDELL